MFKKTIIACVLAYVTCTYTLSCFASGSFESYVDMFQNPYASCLSSPKQNPPESGWTITNYNTHLDLLTNGSLQVTETIAVDFATPKHGIYRFIPLVYEPTGEGFDTRRFSKLIIDDVHVTQDGIPALVSQSHKHSTQCVHSSLAALGNDDLFLKIGDSENFLTGPHTYVISYRVQNYVRKERGSTEIYWNAIPTNWKVPIQQATIQITGPHIYDQLHCYRGTYGSREESCTIIRETPHSITLDVKGFTNAFEGASVIFRAQDGGDALASQVDAPWTWVRYLLTQLTHWLGFTPLLVALTLHVISRRGIRSRGIIAPRFDAPEGISPAQVGLILDQSVDRVDLSAIIISLATKGHLQITKTNSGILGWGTDYTFSSKDDSHAHTLSPEEGLMKGYIFRSGSSEVLLSSLKETMPADIDELKDHLYEWGVQKKIFKKKPLSQNSPFGWWMLFTLAMLLGMAIFFILRWPFWIIYVLSLSCGSILLARYSFYTSYGRQMQEEVQGLRLYLSTAEKDRLVFHNAPEKTPELFEKLLPYAMALGVVDLWAKQFEGIYTSQPAWYTSDTNTFLFHHFIHDIHRTNSSISSTIDAGYSQRSTENFVNAISHTAIHIGNSSKGGGGWSSGGGGGGFSGGGGGGGGGGSW